MGVKLERSLFMGMIFSFNTGTIRIETIMYSELHQPPKIKVKRTIN